MKAKIWIRIDLGKIVGSGAKRILTLFLALLGLAIFPSFIPAAGGTEILLLHTNNVTGYLFPCPS